MLTRDALAEAQARGWLVARTASVTEVAPRLRVPPFRVGEERWLSDLLRWELPSTRRVTLFGYAPSTRYGSHMVAMTPLPNPVPLLTVTWAGDRSALDGYLPAHPLPAEWSMLVAATEEPEFAEAVLTPPVLSYLAAFGEDLKGLEIALDGDQLVALNTPLGPLDTTASFAFRLGQLADLLPRPVLHQFLRPLPEPDAWREPVYPWREVSEAVPPGAVALFRDVNEIGRHGGRAAQYVEGTLDSPRVGQLPLCGFTYHSPQATLTLMAVTLPGPVWEVRVERRDDPSRGPRLAAIPMGVPEFDNRWVLRAEHPDVAYRLLPQRMLAALLEADASTIVWRDDRLAVVAPRPGTTDTRKQLYRLLERLLSV